MSRTKTIALTCLYPQVDRKEATRFEVRHLVSRFFGNSREQLVLNVLEETKYDAEELDQACASCWKGASETTMNRGRST